MKCAYICSSVTLWPLPFHYVHLTILICVDGAQAGDAELNSFPLSVSFSLSTFCSQSKTRGGMPDLFRTPARETITPSGCSC